MPHTIEEVRRFKNGIDRLARDRATSTLRRIGLSWRDVMAIRTALRKPEPVASKMSSYRWSPKS